MDQLDKIYNSPQGATTIIFDEMQAKLREYTRQYYAGFQRYILGNVPDSQERTQKLISLELLELDYIIMDELSNMYNMIQVLEYEKTPYKEGINHTVEQGANPIIDQAKEEAETEQKFYQSLRREKVDLDELSEMEQEMLSQLYMMQFVSFRHKKFRDNVIQFLNTPFTPKEEKQTVTKKILDVIRELNIEVLMKNDNCLPLDVLFSEYTAQNKPRHTKEIQPNINIIEEIKKEDIIKIQDQTQKEELMVDDTQKQDQKVEEAPIVVVQDQKTEEAAAVDQQKQTEEIKKEVESQIAIAPPPTPTRTVQPILSNMNVDLITYIQSPLDLEGKSNSFLSVLKQEWANLPIEQLIIMNIQNEMNSRQKKSYQSKYPSHIIGTAKPGDPDFKQALILSLTIPLFKEIENEDINEIKSYGTVSERTFRSLLELDDIRELNSISVQQLYVTFLKDILSETSFQVATTIKMNETQMKDYIIKVFRNSMRGKTQKSFMYEVGKTLSVINQLDVGEYFQSSFIAQGNDFTNFWQDNASIRDELLSHPDYAQYVRIRSRVHELVGNDMETAVLKGVITNKEAFLASIPQLSEKDFQDIFVMVHKNMPSKFIDKLVPFDDLTSVQKRTLVGEAFQKKLTQIGTHIDLYEFEKYADRSQTRQLHKLFEHTGWDNLIQMAIDTPQDLFDYVLLDTKPNLWQKQADTELGMLVCMILDGYSKGQFGPDNLLREKFVKTGQNMNRQILNIKTQKRMFQMMEAQRYVHQCQEYMQMSDVIDLGLLGDMKTQLTEIVKLDGFSHQDAQYYLDNKKIGAQMILLSESLVTLIGDLAGVFKKTEQAILGDPGYGDLAKKIKKQASRWDVMAWILSSMAAGGIGALMSGSYGAGVKISEAGIALKLAMEAVTQRDNSKLKKASSMLDQIHKATQSMLSTTDVTFYNDSRRAARANFGIENDYNPLDAYVSAIAEDANELIQMKANALLQMYEAYVQSLMDQEEGYGTGDVFAILLSVVSPLTKAYATYRRDGGHVRVRDEHFGPPDRNWPEEIPQILARLMPGEFKQRQMWQLLFKKYPNIAGNFGNFAKNFASNPIVSVLDIINRTQDEYLQGRIKNKRLKSGYDRASKELQLQMISDNSYKTVLMMTRNGNKLTPSHTGAFALGLMLTGDKQKAMRMVPYFKDVIRMKNQMQVQYFNTLHRQDMIKVTEEQHANSDLISNNHMVQFAAKFFSDLGINVNPFSRQAQKFKEVHNSVYFTRQPNRARFDQTTNKPKNVSGFYRGRRIKEDEGKQNQSKGNTNKEQYDNTKKNQTPDEQFQYKKVYRLPKQTMQSSSYFTNYKRADYLAKKLDDSDKKKLLVAYKKGIHNEKKKKKKKKGKSKRRLDEDEMEEEKKTDPVTHATEKLNALFRLMDIYVP